jgi:beta-aspartyl-peptidase (threonine type)
VAIRSRLIRCAPPALVVHGGAGVRPRGRTTGDDAALLDAEVRGLHDALAAGWAILAEGGDSLAAVVAAVAAMEDSGVFNAGRGAVTTCEGGVETDAAVMGLAPDGDGGWREVAGAACAMTWPANPVAVARAVAETGDALLLAGPGADRFAAAAGLPRRDEAGLTHGGIAPVSEVGTVGAVAVDAAGRLAAATSTGGRAGQRAGRVGDSPVHGAGTWAEAGGAAVSATGDGEAFVLAGFAHRIDAAVRAGDDPERAAVAALGAVARWRGTGGGIVLTADGQVVVCCDTPAMARGWRDAGGAFAEVIGPD